MTRNGGRNAELADPVDTIYLALSRDVSLSPGLSERDSFLGEAWLVGEKSVWPVAKRPLPIPGHTLSAISHMLFSSDVTGRFSHRSTCSLSPPI
jgi:hypothetical protein